MGYLNLTIALGPYHFVYYFPVYPATHSFDLFDLLLLTQSSSDTA